MIAENLFLILILFFFIIVLYLLSKRIRISFPIVLVIGGLLASLIPAVPSIKIDPDLVFLLILPPLLFEAAWYTSLADFLKWRKEILMMGFGLVFITSISVAYFSVWLIPGFTLALGFLLGGIISPPDAVATTSILKELHLPKKGLTILEGESLINDAASLTVFRFALITVITGQFSWTSVSINFFTLSIGGIFIGLGIAAIIYFLLRYVTHRSNTIVLSLVTLFAPYLMYLIAEHFNCSGVLAVVSGGLFLSFFAKNYMTYSSRIQTKEILETISFLLNGIVFILIGLEIPILLNEVHDFSISESIRYGLIISALVITVRIIWVLSYHLLSNKKENRNWKLAFITSWSGLRGVVSLASALSIPLLIHGDSPFPFRNLILLITFTVIFVTLIFQGLTLPYFMRKLNLKEEESSAPHEQQLKDLQLKLAKDALLHLENSYQDLIDNDRILERMKKTTAQGIRILESEKEEQNKERFSVNSKLYFDLRLDIIKIKRSHLHQVCTHTHYDNEVVRSVEHSLDLEEARLISAQVN